MTQPQNVRILFSFETYTSTLTEQIFMRTNFCEIIFKLFCLFSRINTCEETYFTYFVKIKFSELRKKDSLLVAVTVKKCKRCLLASLSKIYDLHDSKI